MLKFIKMFSVILIIFSISLSFYSIYASDINMNLMPENNTPSDPTENIAENIDSSTVDNPQTQTSLDNIVSPSGVGTITEEGLGLSNILNILLITVGVILILLAIAIIIRLK